MTVKVKFEPQGSKFKMVLKSERFDETYKSYATRHLVSMSIEEFREFMRELDAASLKAFGCGLRGMPWVV